MPGHKVVRPEDVTDEMLVAGQLRALKREVHSGFELITGKLLTAFQRVEQKIDDLGYRVEQLERDRTEDRQRLAAIELRLQTRRKKVKSP